MYNTQRRGNIWLEPITRKAELLYACHTFKLGELFQENGIMKITQKLLNSLFYYEDGKLFNKVDRASRSKKGDRAGASCGKTQYRLIRIDGKNYMEHRVIFLMHHGYLTKYIDHIKNELTEDGIKSNKIGNLREVSSSSNNQRKILDNGKKYRGVYKQRGRWYAQISVGGVKHWLGVFDNPEDAARAYDEMAFKAHGVYAYLNFKEDFGGEK